MFDTDQRRISAGDISGAIFPVTAGTVLLIHPLPEGQRLVLFGFGSILELQHPGHLVRIHIEIAGLRIEGGASPFATAVKARQHQCTLF